MECLFDRGDSAVWAAPASLKRYIEVSLLTSRKMAILKSWCLLYVQSYLEIFIHHLVTAAPVLPTDNISPIHRYIFEI